LYRWCITTTTTITDRHTKLTFDTRKENPEVTTRMSTQRLSKTERQQLALERRKNQVLDQKRREHLNMDRPLEPNHSIQTIKNRHHDIDIAFDRITEQPLETQPRQKSTSHNILSLEELIARKKQEGQLDTPKFLSKRERQQIEDIQKLQELDKKKKNLEQEQKKLDKAAKRPYEPSYTDSIRLKRTKDDEIKLRKSTEKNGRGRKFQFDWDDEEDTTNNDLISQYGLPAVEVRTMNHVEKARDQTDELHWSQKPLDKMKNRDWRIMKEDFEIITRGTGLANPLRSWDESPIPAELLNIIYRLGYKEPTPIQRASIPISLKKKDLIGVAETGSGKTLAFLIPMLSRLLQLPRLNEITKSDGPYGLILVPTRELAQQIELELNKFVKYLPHIDTISIVGGKLIEKNILDLQNKTIEIIIATPGRLIDCLERHYLVLNQIQFLVLDESDKMIEMNFGEQVEKITEFITNSHRQNMMFTATLTNEVENLSRKYVNEPAIVNIGSASSKDISVNERITQKFEFFNTGDEFKKQKALEKIITSNQYKPPIIVFINYKETGEQLFRHLQSKGVLVSIIHGSKSQDQREYALKQLKDGRVDVLIATSVASRGIDVNNVSLVINYQMTRKIDEYIHRIGRTGRAGNYGTAITFLSEEADVPIYPELKKLLQKSGNKVPDEFKKLGYGLQAII
jgi:ATP-dependent RNA helicase DDX23/PRP28